MLNAEGHEQVRRLNAEPTLRRELETVTLAITKRLSPAEKADLKGGNVVRLASSLGVTHEQAASLRLVHERARALQDRSLRQSREIGRANQLNIRP
ncbi:hypothetical protein [Sinorhizobium psoraleae]|uniref:Bartonella effector protein BID domain-containing protein n=1 Tax=Sinorhizobium psoraleae TaxID=520838 RepID=A0ABT4K9X7_9HYPH|nr:hypothetical protein [Sinorhizobium psoraleae]MCZ4088634.1 hypothetical protein [Sinorhizobium psoraleae]